jgi:hypothetical protein
VHEFDARRDLRAVGQVRPAKEHAVAGVGRQQTQLDRLAGMQTDAGQLDFRANGPLGPFTHDFGEL